MKLDITLIFMLAGVWTLLASTYALAAWPGMIGNAWVWSFGAALFVSLGLALRRAARSCHGGGQP